MLAGDELRGFLARLLGWSNNRAVKLAIRLLELAADHRATLTLCGDGDLVPIARTLHRRAFGPEQPFVVCDPRRGNTPASVRSPANHTSGIAAFAAAAGGALCARLRRLPRDFPGLMARLQSTDDVLFIVCIDRDDDNLPLLARPAPIRVPPLTERKRDLPRIIDEYAHDAIAELAARLEFTADDRAWVLRYADTLAEIEKATLRLVASRTSPSLSQAAARLGMAEVSLSRWLNRRPPRPARR